jgi:hypothetical protein
MRKMRTNLAYRQVMQEFNVTETAASLGLALYVLGCGFFSITVTTFDTG